MLCIQPENKKDDDDFPDIRACYREMAQAHTSLPDCIEHECDLCSWRDCPQHEPLHYHRDGCPVCTRTLSVPRSYSEATKGPRMPLILLTKERVQKRVQQIDIGKATAEYKKYIELIPRHLRRQGDPQTPRARRMCSKRSWCGVFRLWRLALHKYALPGTETALTGDSSGDD